MNKKVIFTILGALIILGGVLFFLNKPLSQEGCRFEAIESTNYQISNVSDVLSVLVINNWNITENFDIRRIKEINTTNGEGFSYFIKNKNIRYWEISAYKKSGEKTRRADLIDEKGRLYKFYNCV